MIEERERSRGSEERWEGNSSTMKSYLRSSIALYQLDGEVIGEGTRRTYYSVSSTSHS